MVTGLVSDFHTIIVIAPSILKHLHDLSKIAMCADVFIFFWFLVVVLNGGTPWGWLWVSRGSIVLCGSFWWVVVFNKPCKIEM